VLDGAPARN